MAFFEQAITVLQTLVIALGAGLGIWGVINLLEGYGNDNPGAKITGHEAAHGGMFDSVNQQVGDISVQVGQTPQGWNGGIFSMIQNLSNSIMVPIAGVILAIVMTLELIQMITDKKQPA